MKRYTTLTLAAGAASVVLLTLAPAAAADPGIDTGGSAADVISNLQSEGYLVHINWTSGFDTEPLDVCWVNGVNNPGNFKPGGPTAATVYVDVQCPNHDW
ncbi:hypothetical protein [Mycobacterium sp. OTB74]|jgi:hypothetical protein|uniref:hypothetical protein n=1 Tax=Mycobacterium sp. OTB74 TaxID=1853452 RepID=UPI002474C2BC|nr:hypothetical protein [Mycobacterium sp. OTB74]MDH6245143.1 hypothetical protein [Mycobacterium sp. OTB74]